MQRELQESFTAMEKEKKLLEKRVTSLEAEAEEREMLHTLKIKERSVLLRGLANAVNTLQDQCRRMQHQLDTNGKAKTSSLSVTRPETKQLGRNLVSAY